MAHLGRGDAGGSAPSLSPLADLLANQGAAAATAPWVAAMALAFSVAATVAAWTFAATLTLRQRTAWSAWGKHVMVRAPKSNYFFVVDAVFLLGAAPKR